MNAFLLIRNFLVGKSRIESRLEYKSALLRGNMALLALLVGFAYIIIDYLNAVHDNYPYYAAVIVFALMTILLNQRRHFHWANILFLFTINLIIFLFSSSDLYRTGTYMFFICISLSAFSLFGFRQIRYAILFSMMSLALFLLSYLGGFSILKVMDYSESYITINFTTNFLVALITSILIVYFLIDINHRSEQDLIRTSEELQRSRERNEMVVEAVCAGIYEWKLVEKTIFVSTTWKRLLGYEEHELKDFSIDFFYSILHPDDVVQMQENINKHFIDKKPYFNELRLRTKSGQYVWFMDNGITKFDAQGQPLITVGSIIDIDERKRAEEKILRQNELLAKANTELDQFVYSVSHDLRAPLSSILGLTNVYNLTEKQNEKESIVKLISDQANTLDSFIGEILDYSRNSRTELKKQTVNVLQVVDEVFSGLTYMQGFGRIRVEKNIHQDLVILTDRERLKVILSNLIANGVKYSNAGTESFICVEGGIKNQSLTLSVKDNGIGIHAEHHTRIFEMFYQAHDHAHGSGLGLYIVKETVQKLGGSISVDSEHGVGSTFTITLPVSRSTTI